jgi:hypothetical protein
MKKRKVTFITLILLFCCLSASSQYDSLYYSGFDTYAEQFAWIQIRMGEGDPYVPWVIDSSGYSTPNCLFHDYVDNSMVEDWYMSPHIINGSISSVSMKTMVFSFTGSPAVGDYFGVWFSPTSVNPGSGTFTEIANLTAMANPGNTWHDTTITGFPGSAGWIAFRFMNASDWFTARVDNFFVRGNLVSVEENSPTRPISLYPNPVKGSLTIDGLTNKTHAEVYDKCGKLLLTRQLNTNQIETGSLAEGLYFIKLTTKEGSVVRKFVKE